MSRPQQRGYSTCIPFVPFWAVRERCEGNTSFACVLTEHSGQQSSLRERTRISFIIGLNAPKCHDLVSLAPQPSMPHFHPLPCPPRTSRFLTQTPSPCNGYLGHPFEKKAAWAFFVRLFLVVRRDSAIDRGGESFSFPRKNSGEWTANHQGRHAKAAGEACHRLLQA